MTFAELIWGMFIFFFWFMAIWIFIQIFADIFRRNDISGGWKAIWVLVLIFLPFLGALIYLVSRPKMTEQDKEELEKAMEMQRRMQGYSAADEIAKLNAMRESGQITAEEYEKLKARALMDI